MTGWTSPTHIILLLLIALLLFGAKRLPEIGRSLGSGMREFKDSVTGHESEEPKQQLTPVQSVETTVAPPVPVETPAAAPKSEHERETV
jgi:sec-independent protein translocase protein TatA